MLTEFLYHILKICVEKTADFYKYTYLQFLLPSPQTTAEWINWDKKSQFCLITKIKMQLKPESNLEHLDHIIIKDGTDGKEYIKKVLLIDKYLLLKLHKGIFFVWQYEAESHCYQDV